MQSIDPTSESTLLLYSKDNRRVCEKKEGQSRGIAILRLAVFSYFILFLTSFAFSQNFALSGKVLDTQGRTIGEAIVTLENTEYLTSTSRNGQFILKNVKAGTYTLLAFSTGKEVVKKTVEVSEDIEGIVFELPELSKELDEVRVQADRERSFGIRSLRAVEGMGIYEGKKSEVIVLKDITANLATNNPRQVYARITGLNIWESDGVGLQLGIGGRGLSPNRTSNFNTRQNGYDISADALGYPESYYTPPAEALERIEIVRGAASLQYGTQFGGMLNFKFKKGPRDKKIELTSRQTVGSWGFLGSFNSVGGTVGKVNYYTFYQRKQGNGWRPNSQFTANTAYASMTLAATEKLSITTEYTYMDYLAKQAGGLTDAAFAQNPRQSLRGRNWFGIGWNLLSVSADYRFTPRTQLNVRTFGLLADRQSLGNLERINVADLGGNRTLIDGEFRNAGTEVRLLHRYRMGAQNQVFLAGVRYYRGTSTARQGDGNNGEDADFRYLNPGNLENSDYRFPNKNESVFVENIFYIGKKLSITPGIRLENIRTGAQGYYKQRVLDFSGNVIVDNRIDDNQQRDRAFIIGGIGLSYKKSDQLEVYGNISQNYRAINFTDLRVVNPNFAVDPNLRDETGYTADLGIRGNATGRFIFDLTAFMVRYNDRIGQLLKADQPPLFLDYRLRTNVADALNLGIEAFGELNLLPSTSKAQLNLFVNGAIIDARYINTDDNTIRDKRVEMVPPIMFRTGLNFRKESFTTSLQFSHTAEHFTDATNARRTSTAVEGVIPAYQVVDYSAAYRWKFLTAELSVNNLLNKMYFTRRAEAYPGPGIIPSDGRGFYLTIQAKF